MSADSVSLDALAAEICAAFDARSPFAFVSDPNASEQRFVGIRRGLPKRGRIEFLSDELPDARIALIRSLRLKRRVVCDLNFGERMSPALRAIYGQDKKIAVSMGLDVPSALKQAFLALWAAEADAFECSTKAEHEG
jgi:hypothetical protein